MSLLTLLPINNNNKAGTFFISTNTCRINDNVTRPFMTIIDFYTTKTLSYPHEVDNTMLFPLLILLLFTFFVGVIGIPFTQEGKDLDILSKWLNSSINLLHKNVSNSVDWYEFVTNATFSVSIAFVGIFIAFLLYKPVYSSFKNLNLINSLKIKVPMKLLFLGEKIINIIYNWSYNRGYIDSFYKASLTASIRGLAEFTQFFDRKIVDGITNGVGILSFFIGEVLKYVGNGRISAYLFLYLLYLLISFHFF